MGTFYLIRHGQASFGADDYDVLSGLGQLQSEKLANFFTLNDMSFDVIASGNKKRQKDTALASIRKYRQLDREHELQILDNFNEIDTEALARYYMPLVMKEQPDLLTQAEQIDNPARRFKLVFSAMFNRWVNDTGDLPIQSWQAFKDSVESGLLDLISQHGTGKNIAVFTSGGPISACLHMVDSENTGFNGLDWGIANTSVTKVSYGPGGLLELQEKSALHHLDDTEISFI